MARAAGPAVLGIGSAIRQSSANPADYDVVAIGTPIWANSLVPAVRSYVKQYRKQLKTVAFFCTAGNPEKLRVFSQMEKLVKRGPLATLAVHTNDVKANAYGDAVRSFVERICPG